MAFPDSTFDLQELDQLGMGDGDPLNEFDAAQIFDSPYLTLDQSIYGDSGSLPSSSGLPGVPLHSLMDFAPSPPLQPQQQQLSDSAYTVVAEELFPQSPPAEQDRSGSLRQDSGHSERQDRAAHDVGMAQHASKGSTAQMQLEGVKEKNRVAQAKYRARQRERRKETNVRITELTKQLAELQSRQAEMANREAIFDRFLSSQRLHLAPTYPGLALADGSISELRADPLGAREQWTAGCTNDDHNPVYTTDVWVNKKTRALGAADAECGFKAADRIVFTAREPPLEMSRQEMLRMKPSEYGALWQDIINGLAACLLRANNDLDSPAGKRLLELCYEARHLKKAMGFFRPDTLAAHAKQVAEKNGTPSAGLWVEIAGSMLLTPEQRENCVLLRNAAYISLGALMQQREELSRKWMSFPGRNGCALPLDSNDYLHSADAAAQLQSMLHEENSFTAQLMMNLFGKILNPLQTAHSHVLAFPFELNALAFLNAIAAAAPEEAPPAAELMQKGAVTAEVPPLSESVKHVRCGIICH